jgi:hypothetical protein
VGAKDRAKRLEQATRSDLSSFELSSGATYYHVASGELYLYCYDCIGKHPDSWPEVPELLRKVLEAKDPRVALEQVMSPAISDIFPYDAEVLVTERRLEPTSIVAGHDPSEAGQADEDLSE